MKKLFAAAVAAGILAGLALTPVAQAADQFVFAGRGNGHGTGLSQWGAWQGAREGHSFAEILAFYYPGTSLENVSDVAGVSAADTVLKVRVSANPPTNNTTSYSQVVLAPAATEATLVKHTNGVGDETQVIQVGSPITLSNSGGKVSVVADAGTTGPYDYVELRPAGANDGTAAGRVEVSMTPRGSSTVYSRQYWGIIRVQYGDDPGELWTYNFVPLERYVRSIAEVEYDWATVGGSFYAPEAVKAQAVAARTYALAKGGATLNDNWADQCYRGYTFEAKYPGIAKAADGTAGLILTYDGEPITAYFSGHSGGYTTDSAWSGTKPPYIVAQSDPWSLKAPPAGTGKGPGWSWNYTISAASLSSKVNGSLKDITGAAVNVGLIDRVDIVARDTADSWSHARQLRITGSNGSATVSVQSFRSVIGTSNLPSTLILSVNGEGGAGEPLAEGEFHDVRANHLYHDQISRVVTAGLMGGYEGGLFKPEGTVTRAQFAKIAVNLYNLLNPGSEIQVVNVTAKPFDDVAIDSRSPGDASDWIAAAKMAGLVAGVTADTFAPYSEIRRDQMTTMICRALGWEDEAAALQAGTPGFADVPAGSAHYANANYLREQGIMLGYADQSGGSATVLGVSEPIKRQHVAVILCRVLDLAE
ncbi:MAG: SpoIID/LytB domain-containing protein [Thermoleophilia bacterium]|nr:SpoIID/LytB domain-containing protein [Thermoleophilia bacterium]